MHSTFKKGLLLFPLLLLCFLLFSCNDEIQVNLVVATTQLEENGAAFAIIARLDQPIRQIARSVSYGNKEFEVTVPITIGGTAERGVDYLASADSLTIPPGETEARLIITPIDDSLAESEETIEVTMGEPTQAKRGPGHHTIITLFDDETTPQINFTGSAVNFAEAGGTTSITATLSTASSREITVAYTVTGTATSGSDHNLSSGTITFSANQTSKELAFTVTDDTLEESTETIIVTLSDPQNAALGSSTTYTLSIIDNDVSPDASFSIAGQVVAESVGTVTVTINLSFAAPNAVSISLNVTGTSEIGVDHDLSSRTFEIDAGDSSGSFNFSVTNDSIDESNETVIVTMTAITNGHIAAPSVHTVTITDDDGTPTVEFIALAQSVLEDAGTVNVVAGLDAASGQGVDVPFTVAGTAANPADHNLADGTITITAGSVFGTQQFQVVDDGSNEGNETVIVTMGAPTNANAGTTTVHTVTIVDNDRRPKANFSREVASLPCDGGHVPIAVELDAPSTFPVTVPIWVEKAFTSLEAQQPCRTNVTLPPGAQHAKAHVQMPYLCGRLNQVHFQMGDPIGASKGKLNRARRYLRTSRTHTIPLATTRPEKQLCELNSDKKKTDWARQRRFLSVLDPFHIPLFEFTSKKLDSFLGLEMKESPSQPAQMCYLKFDSVSTDQLCKPQEIVKSDLR